MNTSTVLNVAALFILPLCGYSWIIDNIH